MINGIEARELVKFANDFDIFEKNLKQANVEQEISGFGKFFQDFNELKISLQNILKNESAQLVTGDFYSP